MATIAPIAVVRTLTADVASCFADVALANVVREFPNKPDHALGSGADFLSPTLIDAGMAALDGDAYVGAHWLASFATLSMAGEAA
ncbi:MAG: hypothetical protein ABI886_05305 [Betaproteobacteria bacterium]